MAAVTVPVPAELDLSAVVLAARRPDDRFFCFEQPERDGFVLAGLGAAVTVEATGPGRFGETARRVRELARARSRTIRAATRIGPPAAGPVFVGGFAFAHDGGGSPEWSSLAPATLVLPEVSLARYGDEARMTVCVAAGAGDDAETLLPARPRAAAAVSRRRPCRCSIPDPVGRTRGWPARRRRRTTRPPWPARSSGSRPGDLRRSCSRARCACTARATTIRRRCSTPCGRRSRPATAGASARPRLAFVGASPELLVRRDGARAQTVALAGTTRRSADPAVDDHLGEQLLQSAKDREEQAIVARRIERTLDPVSLWVAAGDEPALVKVQNVQHLATAIRAQLARPLHARRARRAAPPDPRGGRRAAAAAEPLIPALEGLDRGWYAGAVGWTDLAEDGEFCVALRCALLRGADRAPVRRLRDRADSVPADELAETEVKLQALLPLLS